MKRPYSAALVILSALLAAPAWAASPIKATLSLPHDHVLPGVPFDMIVTYTNVDSRPITIAVVNAELAVGPGKW
jgi:hypothetical protein